VRYDLFFGLVNVAVASKVKGIPIAPCVMLKVAFGEIVSTGQIEKPVGNLAWIAFSFFERCKSVTQNKPHRLRVIAFPRNLAKHEGDILGML